MFGGRHVGIAEELIERGARLVHVFDSDPARIAEATARGQHRSIFYAQLPPGGDVGVRDGAFDFVLVPDLSLTTDTAALLGLLRRVLSPAGAALIATPNFDAKAPLVAHPKSRSSPLGYYNLYDAVAAHFTSVRMLGQAPFVGYAIAEFAASDPEPTIDTSLADVQKKSPIGSWCSRASAMFASTPSPSSKSPRSTFRPSAGARPFRWRPSRSRATRHASPSSRQRATRRSNRCGSKSTSSEKSACAPIAR